ncbi:MAG: hypothetical protein ACRDMU_09220 [Gaiellaceae bacterium]
MSAFLTALLLAQEKSTSEEGRDIVISMLVVGLVFVSVIALGQLTRWLSHRRGRSH